MIRVSLVIVLLLALALSATAGVAGQGNGEITGFVVNGTAGGPGIGADQSVTLLTSTNGQVGGSLSAKTDAQGKFTFSGLSTDATSAYQVLTNYKVVHYTSKAIAFAAGETSKSADVNVFETTDSDPGISAMLGHIVFDQNVDVLRVIEFYLMVNSGDRTYIGTQTPDGKKQTLNMSLPKGASNLQYTNGITELTATVGADSLITSMPLIPGMNGIGFNYQLSNRSADYTFTKKISQDIGQMDVLAVGEDKGIAGEGFDAGEPLLIEGTTYAHISRQGMVAGDVITVRLSRLTPGSDQNLVLWVIVALGVLAVGGAAGYLWRRRGVQPAVSGSVAAPGEEQRLIAELARLDDEFESGKLPEQEYASRRAARKAELVEHLKKTAEGSGE